MSPIAQLLGIRDAALRLRITEAEVRDIVESGELTAFYLDKRIGVPETAVRDYLIRRIRSAKAALTELVRCPKCGYSRHEDLPEGPEGSQEAGGEHGE